MYFRCLKSHHMKTQKLRHFFIALSLLITLSFSAVAQTHDIKINASNALLFEIMGAYEYGLNDNMSVSLFGGYNYGLPVYAQDEYDRQFQKFMHFGYIGPEFRYYVSPRKGCDGFFFGGYMRYKTGYVDTWLSQSGTLKQNAPQYPYYPNGYYYYEGLTKQDFNKLAIGFTLGGKWVVNKGFIIGVFGGFGRNLFANYSDIPELIDPIYFEGDEYHYIERSVWDSRYWDFRFGFNLGWRLNMN